jgi:hypothetical protein
VKEEKHTQPQPQHYPNPFERLEGALARIEALLRDSQTITQKDEPNKSDGAHQITEFIPVQQIFKSGLRSKPAFYSDVKNGIIPLYKMGNRSFVSKTDLHNAFKKVNISGGLKGGARG